MDKLMKPWMVHPSQTHAIVLVTVQFYICLTRCSHRETHQTQPLRLEGQRICASTERTDVHKIPLTLQS
jgi:hypothetical protein